MAILRHKHESDFTVIPNSIFNDSRLNSRDIGILCFMLHLPDDWEFSIKGLEKVLPNDGRDGIAASLKRIEKAGYLHREQMREKNGTLGNYVWIISDVASPKTGYPNTAEPDTVLPNTANPLQTKKGKNKELKKKEHTLKSEPSEDSKKAAHWVEKTIRERRPGEPEFTKAERAEWAQSIEQLRTDGYTKEQISDVLIWWQESEWWQDRIPNGKSLRQNFRQLYRRMICDSENTG